MSKKERAILEVVKKIKNGSIKSKKDLEAFKLDIGRKYSLPDLLKNSEIYERFESPSKKIKKLLSIKPTRTGSGVANIAVMCKGKCPGKCIYCPKGENSPQSYTGAEPATLRAKLNNYDPYKQAKNRLEQLKSIAHPTDKCELIIMGGTFPSYDFDYQKKFIKRCLDAFNEKKSKNLKKAKKINEKAKNRVVGLTIETRPDYVDIDKLLKLGTTRVEIGVQTTDNKLLEKIKRGHKIEDVKNVTKKLKNAGLKVCYHWMPGLTGLNKEINFEKEIADFKKLFEDDELKPDELKIYPTLVIPNTKLYDLYKQGKYKPISIKKMKKLLIELKRLVPKYVRIKRVMRDISQKEVVAGPGVTNLRQLAKQEMNKHNIKCNCIRCREIRNKDIENPELKILNISKREKFLSFVDEEKLIGFLRLRLLDKKVLVRELHIYGPSLKINEEYKAAQHSGFGKKLLKKAEKIAKEKGKDLVQVTSGIGVREYYRNLGYKLKNNYMIKRLN